jgi:hypothetical protein
MLRQRPRVPLRPQLVQQPGRALDVREEEGDGAGGEVGAHGRMIHQRQIDVTVRRDAKTAAADAGKVGVGGVRTAERRSALKRPRNPLQ